MAILHGSWLIQNQGGCLFIWGENWRSFLDISEPPELADVPANPLAMPPDELVECLRAQSLTIAKYLPLFAHARQSAVRTRKGGTAPHASLEDAYSSLVIALPTYISEGKAGTGSVGMYPLHSATLPSVSIPNRDLYNTAALAIDTIPHYSLQPWRVGGFCLNPTEAMKFLNSLPLGAKGEDSFLGEDLRFWSQIARWSLDLSSRCKFLPTINRQANGSVVAGWQALLDSAVDSSRLERFAKLMPAVCRTYQQEKTRGSREQGEWRSRGRRTYRQSF